MQGARAQRCGASSAAAVHGRGLHRRDVELGQDGRERVDDAPQRPVASSAFAH